MKNRLAILYLIVFLFSAAEISAYEVDTHAKISEGAFNVSVLKGGYLNNLWLTETEKLKDKDVADWIIEGSKREDNIIITLEFIRPRNHFFDPIDGKGLTVKGKSIGKPAPNWALEDPNIFTRQSYSIKDAKGYLFEGLTATKKAERDKKLALTFRALGQVLHLVQDMASPQHVRNDPHLGLALLKDVLGAKSEYEEFVDDQKKYLNYAGYTPPTLSTYREFWKTGKGEGLAEFTNRNFVSVGTNFDTTTYPSPSLSAVTTIGKPIQDRSEERRGGKACRSRWSPYR